jgi:MFS family permease
VSTVIERLGPVRAYRELRRDFDRAIFVLAAGDLVASFGFSLVFPFLTIFLTTEMHASATQAGLVLGGYSVCSIFSNAAGGWLADRFGRKVVMTASISLTAVVVAAMGQVHELWAIGVLTLILGLVDPAFVPAARAAVADVVPEAQRSRAYGLLSVAASVGWIAGPSIGAGLSTLGYPFLFLVAGVILAVYTLILVLAFRETRPTHEIPVHEIASGVSGIAPVLVGSEPEAYHAGLAPGRVSEGATGPDALRVFAAFLPIGVIVHAVTFQWVSTLPIHASRELGVSTTAWGLLFALNGLLIVALQLRIVSSTERLSKPRVMALGLLAYGIGYLVLVLADGPVLALPVLAATILFATLGEMLVFPTEPSFVSDLSPIAERGRYQGMFGAAAGLGSAIGPPLGGFLLDALPGAAVWLCTAAAAGVAAAALWWLGGPVARMRGVNA